MKNLIISSLITIVCLNGNASSNIANDIAASSQKNIKKGAVLDIYSNPYLFAYFDFESFWPEEVGATNLPEYQKIDEESMDYNKDLNQKAKESDYIGYVEILSEKVNQFPSHYPDEFTPIYEYYQELLLAYQETAKDFSQNSDANENPIKRWLKFMGLLNNIKIDKYETTPLHYEISEFPSNYKDEFGFPASYFGIRASNLNTTIETIKLADIGELTLTSLLKDHPKIYAQIVKKLTDNKYDANTLIGIPLFDFSDMIFLTEANLYFYIFRNYHTSNVISKTVQDRRWFLRDAFDSLDHIFSETSFYNLCLKMEKSALSCGFWVINEVCAEKLYQPIDVNLSEEDQRECHNNGMNFLMQKVKDLNH